MVAKATGDSMTIRTGVNLSSYAFGPKYPGVHGTDYLIPTAASVAHFAKKGMNTFPVQLRWERAQLFLMGPLEETYMARLDVLFAEAAKLGVDVVLSPHNFAMRVIGGVEKFVGSAEVPVAAFADFWAKLATRYKAKPNVIFDLVNEPKGKPGITTETWVTAANACIAAIRSAGYLREIFVCGNGYSGAASWFANWYGTANATAMIGVRDPINNLALNIHCYCDADGSGTYASGDVVSEDYGAQKLSAVTSWARANRVKLYLGELGAPVTPKAALCIDKMLAHVHANADVWTGWAWWAAGPWWQTSKLAIEPVNGVDKPQTAWLLPYLTPPPPPQKTDVEKLAEFVKARAAQLVADIDKGAWK
jgi:endoglucanase